MPKFKINDVRSNLSGKDLTKSLYITTDFSNFNFSKANLSYVIMVNCSVSSETNFKDADVTGLLLYSVSDKETTKLVDRSWLSAKGAKNVDKAIVSADDLEDVTSNLKLNPKFADWYIKRLRPNIINTLLFPLGLEIKPSILRGMIQRFEDYKNRQTEYDKALAIRRLTHEAKCANLKIAVLSDDATKIDSSLSLGLDINEPDPATKSTYLHVAACFGRIKAVRHLLEKGVEVNRQDGNGNTALNAMLESDKIRFDIKLILLGILIEAQENPQIANKAGITPEMNFLKLAGLNEPTIDENNLKNTELPHMRV